MYMPTRQTNVRNKSHTY